jgi:hypothetical protein
MIMFYGVLLKGRVTEIIDSGAKACVYTYWISKCLDSIKLLSRKKAIFQMLDG